MNYWRNPLKFIEDMQGTASMGSGDLEDYYPETAYGTYEPDSEDDVYHGRYVAWDGIAGHMLRIPAENIEPAFGNIMHPDQLAAVAKGILNSPQKLLFGAAWGEVSKVDPATIRESIEYADDFPNAVLTTGDEELDEFLVDPYQTVADNYADPMEDPEKFCEGMAELKQQLADAVENEEGDLGEWHFTLKDGHHRVFGAILAGEPYIWVMISGNQLQDARQGKTEEHKEIADMLE